MVKWSLAVVLLAGAAGVAHADGMRGPAGQVCIQAGGGVSRVLATVNSPTDCCTGRMRCAQLLSTQVVARPAQAERT